MDQVVKRLALLLAILSTPALGIDTWTTWVTAHPTQAKQLPPSVLTARGAGTNAYYVMEVDPTTGALPVSGSVTATNPSVGATGAAVPASGTYIAGSDAGTLRGAIVDSSGRQIVAGAGTAGSAAGGVLTVQGSASGTAIPVTVSSSTAPTGRTYADSIRNAYASVNVTTGAWVQLIASTAAAINAITLFDSSGQTLELGTGAALSETRKLIIPPGGLDGQVSLVIASGTRVSIRAVSGTASSGEIDITGFQ